MVTMDSKKKKLLTLKMAWSSCYKTDCSAMMSGIKKHCIHPKNTNCQVLLYSLDAVVPLVT